MSQRQTATGTILALVEEVLPEYLYRRQKGGIIYARLKTDGDDQRKSLGTRDVAVAEEKLRRWLAEVSPKHENGELTFAQVASSWIETYRASYTDKTWRRYQTSLRMLKPHFGELFWSDLNKTKINAYITARRQEGATVATVNRDLAVLSNIVEHAVDQEWSDDNPLRSMSRKKRRETRQPFTLPTDEMIEWVWRHMRTTFGDLCRFALNSGMRKDEIVFLDKRRNILFDRQAAQLFKTKTHRVRVVSLSDEAMAVVRRQPGDGLLFVTRNGEHYRRVTEMWREVMNHAERSWVAHHGAQPFVRFRFHDLRHIYAIRFLRNGGNIYTLQKQLGHSTIRQTEEYLQYLTPEEQARAQGSVS